MTSIFFEYKGSHKRIEFDKVICFHGNVSKQLELSEIILDGLNGMDKNFLLNNTDVKKKSLNVIDFSNGLITDDLKMTSKSYNLKIVKEVLSSYEALELLGEELTDKLNDLQQRVNQRYRNLAEEYPTVIKPTLEIKSIEELIVNQFSLVDKNGLTNTLSKELQISLIIEYVNGHPDDKFYFLINQFNESLDLSELLFLFEKIQKTDNLVCIIFTNSSQLYYYTSKLCNHYFLTGNQIHEELVTVSLNSSILPFMNLMSADEIEQIVNVEKMTQTIRKYENIIGEHEEFVNCFFEKHDINDV